MLEDIKTLLGDAAQNYTDAQINLALRLSLAEVEDYCGREVDAALEMVAIRIAVIKLNRLNTEGLASQGFSGTNEAYIDGYPADILSILNRKRRIRVV